MLLLMLASAAFGGVIGGLGAAAVSSQANPQAIAAAVKRVSDKNAESTLRSIESTLTRMDVHLSGSTVYSLLAALRNIDESIQTAATNQANNMGRLWDELVKVCDNTYTGGDSYYCTNTLSPTAPYFFSSSDRSRTRARP